MKCVLSLWWFLQQWKMSLYFGLRWMDDDDDRNYCCSLTQRERERTKDIISVPENYSCSLRCCCCRCSCPVTGSSFSLFLFQIPDGLNWKWRRARGGGKKRQQQQRAVDLDRCPVTLLSYRGSISDLCEMLWFFLGYFLLLSLHLISSGIDFILF